jgi:hypothetical protein
MSSRGWMSARVERIAEGGAAVEHGVHDAQLVSEVGEPLEVARLVTVALLEACAEAVRGARVGVSREPAEDREPPVPLEGCELLVGDGGAALDAREGRADQDVLKEPGDIETLDLLVAVVPALGDVAGEPEAVGDLVDRDIDEAELAPHGRDGAPEERPRVVGVEGDGDGFGRGHGRVAEDGAELRVGDADLVLAGDAGAGEAVADGQRPRGQRVGEVVVLAVRRLAEALDIGGPGDGVARAARRADGVARDGLDREADAVGHAVVELAVDEIGGLDEIGEVEAHQQRVERVVGDVEAGAGADTRRLRAAPVAEAREVALRVRDELLDRRGGAVGAAQSFVVPVGAGHADRLGPARHIRRDDQLGLARGPRDGRVREQRVELVERDRCVLRAGGGGEQRGGDSAAYQR